MSRLVITRGLPGCGKTTRARHWVAEDPLTRCRVNRDDLRLMFYATRFTGLAERERAVTVVQYPAIRALLKAGFDVVSDDTWLREDLFQTLRSLAIRAGAIVEVWDMRNVPLDVCIERDAARGTLVGAEVIVGMYRRHILGAGVGWDAARSTPGPVLAPKIEIVPEAKVARMPDTI